MPDSASRQQRDAKRLDTQAVLSWYDRNARILPWRVSPKMRASGIRPDPYRVWLSEVMLQQTTVAAVSSYYQRFTALWPTVADLAAAPLDAVLRQWAGLGYYARARNLHACAQAVVQHHGGVFPVTSEALRHLPGIGAYTSAAIAAICHDEPAPVLDGNVERVLARYLALAVPVSDAKDQLREQLAAAMPSRAGDFAQAMMDLGATICAPRVTLCMHCPLQTGCAGAASGYPLHFPVKLQKPDRPQRFGDAFVMRAPNGAVFLQQRAEKGLLGKMTGTPVSEWSAETHPTQFPQAGDWYHHGEVVHVFTHFRLTLQVWSAEVAPPDVSLPGWWVAPEHVQQQALPTLFRKVLASAGLEQVPRRAPQ